jgi:CubicO group peptidase (beta-lactamase class C family)
MNRRTMTRRTRPCSLAILLLAAVWAAPVHAQEPTTLLPDRPIRATLAGDSAHRYALALEDSTFVLGEVDQVTVDVVVRLLAPDGRELRAIDGPARGVEPFQLETDTAGTFVVEVSGFEGAQGDYVVRLLRSEPLARDAAGRLDQMMSPYTGEDVPGVVVGIVENGELALVRTYGMANLEHGIPFTPGTISNIGSVTKQFTAMGILLLQAEGKLSLDDDIREHIPELPDFGTPVTIKNLLNHTGGYREVYNLLPMAGFEGEDSFRREDVIRIVQRQKELQAPPNTEFNYNNTGFILLATTIERLSGRTFPEYMKARVFEPLGMAHTRVEAYQGEVIPGSAQGYVAAEGGGFRQARDLPASYGAGGIYTTVEDLTRWMLNYRDRTLGGHEAITAITTRAVLENGDTTSYGLGLGVGRDSGGTVYTHTGGDVAHRAFFGYWPELDGGVILLSNNGTFDPGVGRRVASVFFGDRLRADAEVAEGAADPAESDAGSEPDAVTMTTERMEAIAGDWLLEIPGAPLPIVLSIEDGALVAQAEGQSKIRLEATSDTTLTSASVGATFTFHVGPEGEIEPRGTLHQGQAVPLRRKGVEAPAPTAEALKAYEGRYFSEELEVFYDVTVEEGKLIAEALWMEPITLSHREGDEFSGSTFFFGTVAFERDDAGGVTGFVASNARTRGVRFERR